MPTRKDADAALLAIVAIEPYVARFGERALLSLTNCKAEICRSVEVRMERRVANFLRNAAQLAARRCQRRRADRMPA